MLLLPGKFCSHKGCLCWSQCQALFLVFHSVPGVVHHMDEKGRTAECFTCDGPIKSLLYCENKDMLVAITDSLILSQHSVAPDGGTTEVIKVGKSPHVAWYI